MRAAIRSSWSSIQRRCSPSAPISAGTYRRVRAQLLVTDQRNAAYGCAAQDNLNTLDTDYERRGWLLAQADTRPVSRILIQGWTCRALAARSATAARRRHGTVLLLTPPRPASVSLAATAVVPRGARLGRPLKRG